MTTAYQQPIRREQLQLLFQALPTGLAGSIGLAFALTYILWPVVDHWTVILWLTAVCAINVGRGALAYVYRRAQGQECDTALYARWFLLGTVLIALVWGSSAIVIFPGASIEHQVLLAFILAGLSAGGVTSLSFQRAPVRVFLLLILVPLAIRFFLVGSEISIVMGVCTLLFLLILVRTSSEIYHNTLQNTRLRLQAAEHEAILLKTQQHLARHIRDTPLAVIELDVQCIVTAWNPAAESIFGCSGEQAIGKNIRELLFTEQDWQAAAPLFEEAAEKTHIEPQLVTHHLHQEEVICRWINTPLCDDNDQAIGMACIVEDVTTNIKNSEELVVAKEQAEAANKAKSEFLATMSHEIRTPMNGVIGMLQLLGTTALDKQQRGYVEAANSSASILLTVINAILDFSKIEAGRLTLETVTFDLQKLLNELVDIYRMQAEQKGLHFSQEISPLPGQVMGDPTRLRQILTNLLDNAIKFTALGEVGLHVECQGLAQGRYRFTFSVRDTGIGISTDDQRKLFHSFSQADSSTMRRFGGTGLGLAISQRLANLMGSRLQVDSAADAGSCFHFTLELLAGESQGNNVVCDAAGPPVACQGRVLLVDDHAVNLLMAKTVLEQLGLEVTAACDGREALTAWSADHFDLILMDIQMPELDGYATTARIREQEQLEQRPRIPIIALTANALAEDKNTCLRAGMDDHLSKPFQFAQLEAILHKWLPAASCRVAAEGRCDLAGPAPAQAPIIDSAQLDKNRRSLGEHYPQLVTVTLASLTQSLTALTQSAERGDVTQLAREAHRLKGAMGTVGASDMYARCQELEVTAKSNDLAAVRQQLDGLTAAAQSLTAALQESANDA